MMDCFGAGRNGGPTGKTGSRSLSKRLSVRTSEDSPSFSFAQFLHEFLPAFLDDSLLSSVWTIIPLASSSKRTMSPRCILQQRRAKVVGTQHWQKTCQRRHGQQQEHCGTRYFTRSEAPMSALTYFPKLQILSRIPSGAGPEEGPPKQCGAALELCRPADRAPRQ